MQSPDSGPAELLAALARALQTIGAPWHLFGAQAAIIWGRPRLTADVDVTVRLDTGDPAGLISALREAGFTLRVDDAAEFVRRTRVVAVVHLASQLPVYVFLAGPGLEESFLSRAVRVTVAGTTIPVMSPEDLIAVKILAGRAKDIEDVQGILEERGPALDLDGIRHTLGQLEDALGRSDLRPSLDRELERDAGSAPAAGSTPVLATRLLPRRLSPRVT